MNDSVRLLISQLSTLEDPRQAGKVTYPLVEMSMVAVAGVIADCDGWEDVADFGRDRLEWLRQFLPFENGVPSHDTLARVFSIIDVEQLEGCVTRWIEQTFPLSTEASSETEPSAAASATNQDTASTPRPHVAFDGKTMRGSHDRIHDGSPLHVVTAYASKTGSLSGTDRSRGEIQ